MGATMGAELVRFSFAGDTLPAPAPGLTGDKAPAWQRPSLGSHPLSTNPQ